MDTQDDKDSNRKLILDAINRRLERHYQEDGALSRDASSSLRVDENMRGIDSLDVDRKRAINEDMRADTQLKKSYARWFIWILCGQLLVMNLVIIGVGFTWLKFDSYALHLYMAGTLAEVFGVVLVITRYLFSKKIVSK